MTGILELNFDRPVSEDISKGGHFGATRHYGGHKGVDFMAPRGTKVKAIEGGKVVCSIMREGSKEKTRYGNVIVIDHTPDAGENQRHIYSLSAHLDSRGVSRGQKISKGSEIGTSGNTGMRYYYQGKKRGYHLHFEIIDSPRELKWNGTDWHSISLRENPMNDYIGSTLSVDYNQTGGQISRVGLVSRYGPINRF